MKIEELYANSEAVSEKKAIFSQEKANSSQTKEKSDPGLGQNRFSISQGSKTPRTATDSKNSKRKVRSSGKKLQYDKTKNTNIMPRANTDLSGDL